MKNYKIPSVYFLLALFLSFTVVNSCKIKNPIDGMVVTIKASAVGAPNTFRVINAKTGYSDPQFENVVVKITGEDADVIYTADGSKTIRIIEGQFGLSLRNGVKASAENPIKFNLSISVPGYLDLYLPYEFTNDAPVTNTLSLINTTNPPPSVSIKDTFATVNSSGAIVDTLKFVTPIPAGSTTSAEIIINPGTKFFDENGNPFVGKVTAKAVFMDPKTTDDYNAFPGNVSGIMLNDSTLSNPKLYMLDPSAWVTLEFSNNGKVFKKPPAFGVSGVRMNLQGITHDYAYMPGGAGLGFNSNILITTPFYIKGGFNNDIAVFADKNLPNGSTIMGGGLTQAVKVTVKLGANAAEFSNYEFKAVVRKKSNMEIISQPKITFIKADDEFSVNVPGDALSDLEMMVELLNKSTKATTMQTFSGTSTTAVIDLPAPPAKEYYFIVRFAVTCPDNSRITLPAGHTLFLIPENDYVNTLRAVDGRRIFPQDRAINGVKWDQYTVGPEFEENGKRYSTLKIPIGAVKTNTTYRASTIYGNRGRIDNDQNQPLVTPSVFPPGQDYIMVIDMKTNSCD